MYADSTNTVGGYAVMFILLCFVVLVGLALISIPGVPYAPTPPEIKPRPHAVENHGQIAIDAREWIRVCDSLEAYYCNADVKHPRPRYILICRHESVCAGMIVNTQGVELTTWIAPCTRWDQIKIGCQATESIMN